MRGWRRCSSIAEAGSEQILRFAQDDSLSYVILSEAKDLCAG
jgi:hypothetical protein